jgi:Zn-dependent peptidase ImmA (M78 family)
VVDSTEDQPIIAFRKKGNSKTTEAHIDKARETGLLLKPLVRFMPEQQSLRPQITAPSTSYGKVQAAASQARARIGIGELATLEYEHLIGEFRDCGAVLIPALWGNKQVQVHENAMHIFLPAENITFIYLNLDTRIEDFKFWMAHELAHIYTPMLTGKVEGEDFADRFSSTILFPKALAEMAYDEAVKEGTTENRINILVKYARSHEISLYTVFEEVEHFARSENKSILGVAKEKIHMVRNSISPKLVSESIFDPMPPETKRYIAVCESIFRSDFFRALSHMIHETGIGPSYVSQILRCTILDAQSIHRALLD